MTYEYYKETMPDIPTYVTNIKLSTIAEQYVSFTWRSSDCYLECLMTRELNTEEKAVLDGIVA